MKTAISIPDAVFSEAETLAEELGLSRSELYAKAVASYIAVYRARDITTALNTVYGEEPSELDAAVTAIRNAAPLEPW